MCINILLSNLENGGAYDLRIFLRCLIRIKEASTSRGAKFNAFQFSCAALKTKLNINLGD